ncbi:hypothetical protein DL768_005522 [Monosporascus sp. mg162]|nr:hypothetical protein DL768_005522 [Monosporascus sp. mg162]
MGIKDRDDGDSHLTAADDRPREKRSSRNSKSERSKEDKDKDAHKHHHHRHHKSSSSRKHRSSVDGGSTLSSPRVSSSQSHRRHRTREEKERDREKNASSLADLVPELSRTSIPGASSSRVSLPYPSFSKAHSKEDVGLRSREELSGGSSSVRRNHDPITPEATDLGSRRKMSRLADYSDSSDSTDQEDDRPPTPPETDLSGDKRRLKASASRLREEYDRPGSRASRSSRASGVSRTGSKREDGKSKLSSKSKTSTQLTYTQSPPTRPPPPPPIAQTVADDASCLSDDRSGGTWSTATSIPPQRAVSTKITRIPSPIEIDDSPESVQDSSPKTPTVTPQFPPSQAFPGEKQHPMQHLDIEDNERPTPSATPMTDLGGPPPPPPPPPPLNIQEVPRVDYLLQHGGLPHPVPKDFLSVMPRQNGTRPSNPPLAGAETLFAPFFNLLDQYQTVIHKQGSVAVATGHKSVARRLLDRLEDVFSRDLPAEGCSCIMCEKTPEEHRGLGWGEVLERVGGRVELPAWPPFDLANLGINAAELAADVPPRPASPVNLDPDIAEEFRDHYLRQSKKVRSAVDKWMNSCDETPAPPPSEVDDETLAFAMLTSLEQGERPYFNALLSGARELQPDVRAPTPMLKPRTDFLVKTGLALQRLYRLSQAPRDAETAMYLVKNPFHHDLLSTITDINPQEWEILVSGRFDGFLWSGADADDSITPTADNSLSRGATPASGLFSPPPSRGPMTPMRHTPSFASSRNTTPFSGMYSRGTTPASFVSLSSSAAPGSRQPVSHDEEVEVAVLAEVEREIYRGMEALEDAFEKLHRRAEMVRGALRQRNAGLSMSMQSRRAGRIDVLPHSGGSYGSERPAWAMGDEDGVNSESDWGGDDFDIAPEDSASNISSNRHRRPKRRNERRTPAPIEEDDEEI